MPRASNNVQRTKRRKKILKQARGYRGSRSKLYMPAKETLERNLREVGLVLAGGREIEAGRALRHGFLANETGDRHGNVSFVPCGAT